MTYVCIDGNSILNRAFYGIHLLSTKEGVFTNAVMGFLNILHGLQEELQPDGIAVAFDVKHPTFRHEMFDGYKGTRKGMPPELAQQLPIMKEVLQQMGIAILEYPGFEADDILGSFAAMCEKEGHTCVLTSGDRDSFQLISDTTTVRLATTGSYEMMTPDKIIEKYGVTPIQMIDVKALMGDTSDNIPGVPGVGEKTALGLIQQFGSLEGVYQNIEDPFIKKGVRAKLEAGKDSAFLSYRLAKIKTDMQLPEMSTYKVARKDEGALYNLLSKLELKSIIKKLGLQEGDAPAPASETAAAPMCCGEVVDTCPEGDVLDIYHEGETVYVVSGTQVYVTDIHDEILSSDVKKRTFDCKDLYFKRADLQGVVFDGVLAAYLLDTAASAYNLQDLTMSFDAAFTCEVLPALGKLSALLDWQQKALQDQQMDKLLTDIELPLARVLSSMEHIGIGVTREGLVQYGQMLDEKIAESKQQIYDLVGEEFNLNSPKQLSHALFEVLQLPHGKKNKSGGYSTNVDVLNSLRDKHPVIDLILAYRSFAKLKSTYVDGLLSVIAPDGRIHTTFKQTETRTGRISSIEPNLQNIPVRTPLGSELRKFFVAKEGYTLVDADYSQIELRVLAHMAGDTAMQQAFLSGEDVHTATASQVFGVPVDFVTSELRRRAKAVNFGIVYGIGAYSLSQDIGVSVAEADSYIKNYLGVFSGVAAFMDKTVADATQNKYTTTLYGRRRIINELASSNKIQQALGKRMAMNAPIQGTAADIIKIAMCRVFDRLEKEKLDARLILQVHDELIVEAKEDIAPYCAKVVAEEMQAAAQLAVPLSVDAHIGQNWYIAKG